MLLEDFRNTLPDHIVVHLHEHKVAMLAQAAVLADEYTLTHKSVFPASHAEGRQSVSPAPRFEGRQFVPSVPLPARPSASGPSPTKAACECFYCRQYGHLIATCPVLSNKDRRPTPHVSKPKGVKLVGCRPGGLCAKAAPIKPDNIYTPFLLTGLVSLTGMQADNRLLIEPADYRS